MKTIYISFLTTRFDLMKKHWEENTVLKEKGITGTNKEIGRDVDLGGILIEVDWGSKKIIKKHSLSCPSGISRWGDDIVVASMRQNEIYLLNKGGHIIRTISHNLFNDIHSIYITHENTLLVTSTGLDCILEFNKKGDCIWKWFAFEHGYDLDQYGKKRILNTLGDVDYTKTDYPTLYQTTHINSVIQHPSERNMLIATLFHQGAIISINKSTGETGVLLNGMNNPHSIRNTKGGYIVSNTRNGEIVLLDRDFKKYKILITGSSWLQDTVVTQDGNFLAARSDTNDIIEIDNKTGEIISVFPYDKNWRVYQMEYIFQ